MGTVASLRHIRSSVSLSLVLSWESSEHIKPDRLLHPSHTILINLTMLRKV